MKEYTITINGTVYDVQVELKSSSATSRSTAATAPRSTPAPVAPPHPVPSAPITAAPKPSAVVASIGEGRVSAPMPGTILTVNVANGATVKKGDVLFVLEAMKMENEIMAPCDGVVSSVGVTAGTAVESDMLLCVIG